MFIPFLRGFGTRATSLPLHRLEELITPSILATLRTQGYAVIDNVFGSEIALQLRDEVKALRNYMHKNHTHLVGGSGSGNNRSLIPKKDIYEAELLQPETQALAPMCSLLQHDSTLRKALSPAFSTPLDQAIKLQWNAGDGGCFPMHFDTDAAIDTRLITAIWYQNPDWKPEHGGQLQLYPFPVGPAVDLSPILDRMVLFSSRKMVHRVLPSFADRYCFTIWLSGRSEPGTLLSKEQVEKQRNLVRAGLSKKPGEVMTETEAWKLLEIEELRRHALKWVFREEWEESLVQSHPKGQQRDELVARMKFEIEVIEKALRPMLPILERWGANTANCDETGPSIKWI